MKKNQGKTVVEEFRERLDREEMELRWKSEAYDHLLTESKEHPERFLQRWVTPLIGAGLSVEAALALLIEGHFRPN
jgi:hypothetical protein